MLTTRQSIHRPGKSPSISTWLLIACLIWLVGCSSETEPSTTVQPGSDEYIEDTVRSAADLAREGMTPDVGKSPFEASTTPMPDDAGPGADPGNRSTASGAPAPTPGSPSETIPPGMQSIDPNQFKIVGPNSVAIDQPQKEVRPLSRELSPPQLLDYLQKADEDMQLIASGKSGITDPREANQMLQQIARRKAEAGVMLKNHEEATAQQSVMGSRGQLQALSHLAATGDRSSTNALRTMASEYMKSEDVDLQLESRIVLIGFALDDLQSGKEGAADKIVELVNGMQPSKISNVPAVLILGQARGLLSNYGQLEQAASVREKILALYGNSSDEMIAKIAAQAAGNAKFDQADRLIRSIIDNPDVNLSRWTDTATELAVESPDMRGVEYLASAALRFEAYDRIPFVEETFSVLEEQFDEPGSATARQVAIAKEAYNARKEIVGEVINLENLPTVGGTGVGRSLYEGKIILMPFWVISMPGSLEITGLLRKIRDENPDKVTVIGMNLDPEGAPLEELMREAQPDFPSYRSMSSPTAAIPNVLASRFGLVSFPFVAILDDEFRVLALDFTGERIEQKVATLVELSK